MMRVALFGSTGSIGTQALELVRLFPEEIRIVSLMAGSNAQLLLEQAREFLPEVISLAYPKDSPDCPRGVHYIPAAEPQELMQGADVVLNAVTGFAGLSVSLAAARLGKRLCLANKESLVTAGELLMKEANISGASILPVDSEHAAIHQCLAGQMGNAPRRLILTASGGPFRQWTLEQMRYATPEQALRHPNWAMGPRITIDSATMMNKALELIEAKHLFNVNENQLEVLIHPQSIIHSMVEYQDGSVLAQMGIADMRLPILYALCYPERQPLPFPKLDLAAMAQLTFEPPDEERFTALKLARQVILAGGNAGAVFNAADETAVELFLQGRCGFMQIADAVQEALEKVEHISNPSYEEIRLSDERAREAALQALTA